MTILAYISVGLQSLGFDGNLRFRADNARGRFLHSLKSDEMPLCAWRLSHSVFLEEFLHGLPHRVVARLLWFPAQC